MNDTTIQSPAASVLHLRSTGTTGGGIDSVLAVLLPRLAASPECAQAAGILCKPNVGPDQLRLAVSLQKEGVTCRVFHGQGPLSITQLRRLYRFCREQQVTIIHAHDPKSYVYGRLLTLLSTTTRFVATLHGWASSSRKFTFYTWLARQALRGADKVVAVSTVTGEQARKFGLRNVEVLPNGIDLDQWAPPDDATPPARPSTAQAATLIFAGRLSPEKQPLDFLRVAQLLRQKRGDLEFRFVVVGGGCEEMALKKAAVELSINSHVTFKGVVSSQELKQLYMTADVLLLTSASEGLPMVLLEAAAANLNMVATDVGGVRDIIIPGTTGLTAPAGNIDALANAVLTLLDDQSYAKQLRQNARQLVKERFSIDIGCQRLLAIYGQVCRQARTGKAGP